MKQLPYIVAIAFATFYFTSLPAQNMGSGTAVADTLPYNYGNILSTDSLLVYNYLNLSKQYLDKNPDSSIYWADLALQFAAKTNDSQLINTAVQQKNYIQQYNFNKINKQNHDFKAQNPPASGNTTLLIIVTIILFAACIYLSFLIIKKNNNLKEMEVHKENLETKNKELLIFQKEVFEKNAEIKQNAENNDSEIAKVNSIKDRLIPMIAHDIRSPLASVQHMLSLTRENVLSPEEFQKLSFALEADIYNLRGMLDNMLLWTREQMIEIKINKTLFNISDAVKEVILMHRNSLITKNITINNYLQPDLEVFSDKEIVTAVLRNIFSNAVKFTQPDKNIYINQIYLNKKIYISIKDEGKGMSEEIIEKIKSSEHISTRGSANEKGTGIGIMFTKDLLKKMDEIFDITSMVGSGTSVTFSITMPEGNQPA